MRLKLSVARSSEDASALCAGWGCPLSRRTCDIHCAGDICSALRSRERSSCAAYASLRPTSASATGEQHNPSTLFHSSARESSQAKLPLEVAQICGFTVVFISTQIHIDRSSTCAVVSHLPPFVRVLSTVLDSHWARGGSLWPAWSVCGTTCRIQGNFRTTHQQQLKLSQSLYFNCF